MWNPAGAHEMPGNMSKEDGPSRSSCFTFTIDSILNLKQRQDCARLDVLKDTECKNDFQRCQEVWDVPRKQHSDETGDSHVFMLLTNRNVFFFFLFF